MSGSGEYTTTPNLGLYKPLYNADAEQWGNHLNANADVLDGALAGGGPFLPLTGGDVGGTIDANIFQTYNHRMMTGGALDTALGIYGELSGVQTTGNNCFARVNLVSDTLAVGAAGLTTLLIDQQSGGAGTTGNRVGAYINFNFAGGPTNKSLGYGDQYSGLWSYSTATGNVGGATGAGNAWGILWGGVISATLASGSTFWNGCCGLEINAGVSAGASAAYVQGLKIVLAHHAQAVNATDYMLGFAKGYLSDVPLANGIVFGSPDGYWPIAATGTLIGALASLLPTPPPRTAGFGVDFNNVTFGSAAFRSPGFLVDPSGNVAAGAVTASFTATTGLSLGTNTAPGGVTDLSKHIALYNPIYGFNVTANFINSVLPTGASHGFVVNGALVAAIGASGVSVGSAKVLGTQIIGWGTPTGGARTASFNGASATLPQTSAVLAQLILDLKTHGMLGA
jgi:hypothetical protein